MTTETASTGSEPLSVDQAAGMMAVEPEQTPAETAEADDGAEEATVDEADDTADEDSEADPTADEDADPEEAISEDEEGEEPESDPEEPAIAAPRSWDAEGRALWATLKPAVQEKIAAREAARDSAVSKVQNEANRARQAAQAEVAEIAELKPLITQVVTKAEKVFADRWDDVDWKKFMRDDFQAYTIARAEFEEEQEELANIRAAEKVAEDHRRKQETVEFQSWVASEAAALAEIAPDLADPVKGPSLRKEVGQYLLSQGVPAESLKSISAVEMTIAHKARLYDQGMAKFKAAPTPPKAKTAAPSKAPAPSAAAVPARPQKQAQARFDRLAKAGTVGIDDAVSLMLMKG